MYQKENNFDVTENAYDSIRKHLKFVFKNIPHKAFFLGWDGFIDTIYTLVQSRSSIEKWDKMDSMEDFGNLILKVAGSSAGIECVPKKKTIGGFTSNVSNPLSNLGANITLISSWGYPKIDALFWELSNKPNVHCFSFNNPASTSCYEFIDGKIMITNFKNIHKIDWKLMKSRIGLEPILKSIERSDALGLAYWSSILNFNELMFKLVEEIFPSIKNLNNKILFFDLADIKRRKNKDIKSFLELLKDWNELVPIVLSLNDQETIDVSKAIGLKENIDHNKKNYNELHKIGKNINEKLRISNLIVHTPHFATITTRDDHFWVAQAFTSHPSYTTGGGDYFNAGLMAGLVCELTPAESLIIGNALTAFFVRSGLSPNLEKLRIFLFNYRKYLDKDIPSILD
ncbi:MAG: hypothetical protein GF383_13575 [Candidatus Lokiarchaeota archaeon]|nr:hypothetical protein [Candidatus Lokiarchaeota archaeon]MBD3342255.1 hypothetical protein [Candidatus Lokiarchaeota archaeon]